VSEATRVCGQGTASSVDDAARLELVHRGTGVGVIGTRPAVVGLELLIQLERRQHVTIAGKTITDEFMTEFHKQGLAKAFDCYGSFRRRFAWKPAATTIVEPTWR
jgi:hypothetical protein